MVLADSSYPLLNLFWLRMLGPLSGPLGSRMERKIWTGLKHQLETT
jgi:hypothetical protein